MKKDRYSWHQLTHPQLDLFSFNVSYSRVIFVFVPLSFFPFYSPLWDDKLPAGQLLPSHKSRASELSLTIFDSWLCFSFSCFFLFLTRFILFFLFPSCLKCSVQVYRVIIPRCHDGETQGISGWSRICDSEHYSCYQHYCVPWYHRLMCCYGGQDSHVEWFLLFPGRDTRSYGSYHEWVYIDLP